jgi:hypothetical protein
VDPGNTAGNGGDGATSSGGNGVGGAGLGGNGAGGNGAGGNGAGGNSAGGGGSGATGGGGGEGGGTLCDGAIPVLQPDGSPSGFSQCPDGTIHRVEAVSCNPAVDAPLCAGTEDVQSCTTNADCTDAPNGVCVSSAGGFDPQTYCGCVYPCTADSDCGASEVCVCDGVVDDGTGWAHCVSAGCTTNDDCASGECGISTFFDGCFYDVQVGCRDDNDACRLDTDCAAGTCVLTSGLDDWSCQIPNCAIGRPLLVEGSARTAPTDQRADWLSPRGGQSDGPDLSGLDPSLVAELAAHWESIAALEHASVASFARFTLELMALGAPPELLAGAQRAALDEIEHARICYAIASAYAGRPLGPGPLDMTGVPMATDRREILRGLIQEACVGETLGAAEARELSRTIADPHLRAAQARIAREEEQHAELAWRTLRWMLSGADRELITFARAVFDGAIEAAGRDLPPARGSAPEHGLLDRRELAELRRQALASVVVPCRDAVLAQLA